jgi:hypothetical protein
MMKPTWVDEAIQTVIDKGDPVAIAQVIANSPQLLDAIKKGLADKPKPGIIGPSYAQIVARAIREAINAL